MNILVIGNGGREHALAWKLSQSKLVDHVFVAPGNAGTALEPEITNVPIDSLDFVALVHFAQENAIALTIVGPEAPLVAGIVDYFTTQGLRCFGPSKAAAQLEGSKAYSKDFLKRHHIPTADYAVFTEVPGALAYLAKQSLPIVIKADGLAAGKGVIIAQTQKEAEQTIIDILEQNAFGDAGSRVVIESFLQGEEASFIVMVDGEDILPFASSQDHKARDNGDLGPNTGGMGAYSPAPVVNKSIHEKIMQTIIEPTVKGLMSDGIHYRGFLYAGVMIHDDSVQVLEFNCRFGDPETQPIMMRLQSDLAELCFAACEGNLANRVIEWDNQSALGVVMAAGGYPQSPRKGDVISGFPDHNDDKGKVFVAGAQLDQDNAIVTSGGRVLCVTALGNSVTEAQQKVYSMVDGIHWQDVFFRTDIGYRAIQRENS